MHRFLLFTPFWAVIIGTAVAAEGDPKLFEAVRHGDVKFLKEHLDQPSLGARDRRGATLLMHAAAFGNVQILNLLVDAGADVNAVNDFDATALLWGARDPEKARILIEHGANVNARSKQGRTPLMLASLRPGGSETVALMLKKGADPKVKDGRGDTALGLAATIGEVETMRLLLAKGADPTTANNKGEPPIILATKSKRPEAVSLLLEQGVDVNVANTSYNIVRNGPIAMIKLTPLHRAAAFGPVQMVRDLLKAGANVNARDGRSLTPLHFAVATDYPSKQICETLLQAGADVNARDSTGETPLDWAEKFAYPDIVQALQKAGAKHGDITYHAPKRPHTPRPQPLLALARSEALLEKSSAEFFKKSGCVGCHHQPLIARAQRPALATGIPIRQANVRDQLAQLKGQWLASQEEFLQSLNPGGGPNRLAENLLGLEAAGHAPDSITDSAIVDLAEAQAVDGSWRDGEEQPRPPITEGEIAGTARAVRALQTYSIPARRPEFDARIAKAEAWLQRAKPASTDDYAMRLLGLAWTGAPKEDIARAGRELLVLQREDGGWSGNRYLSSEAFSTGEALVALVQSGAVAGANVAYRRGLDFLLSTQYSDGSWYVRSRAIKFQPYFESGFPFGHDQWISAAGTAWAVQAIALSISPSSVRARLQAPWLSDSR
ncbi:MAG TPA: ankyrin repeat domain-containing protein [Bryobacteraceae bacterium]|jgi:ankyrin repeat protein